MKSIVTKTSQRGTRGSVWVQVIKNWSLQGKMTDSVYYRISKAVFYLVVKQD
jgi:hypothetical protein